MSADEYLTAASDDAPAIAAAEVMDRLAERLNAVDSTAGQMKEKKAAGEAVAQLAEGANDTLAVVEAAENAAKTVAQKARTPEDQIKSVLSKHTKDARRKAAEDGLSLDYGCGLDEYLEHDLETVRRIESTDHHTDTTLSWQFSDGATVELNEGTHLEKYNFYKQLAMATEKKLQPEIVSEEIGDPDEDGYDRLSLGPKSRPWADENWIRCITDLLDERRTAVKSAGPRTTVWEAITDEIHLSRAASRIGVAVDQLMPFAKAAEGGGLDEVWLPAKMVLKMCDDHGIEPQGLQEELAARGVDSDELGGERISERVAVEEKSVRFWRLDATHDEVPEPADIVDEIETGTERLNSIEWGDLDE